jgi:hypothetical protein
LARQDVINISADDVVTLTGNLDATGEGTGNIINVYGELTIDGNLDGDDKLVINVSSTGVLIMDSWVATGSNNMTVNNSGTVTILNNVSLGNSSQLNINGSLNVGGSITVGNSSTLEGSGTVELGGVCEGPASFCESGPLPIELLYFIAKQSGDYVLLEWSTASELNNDYFTIERSRNGVRFDVLANIEGNGTVNSTIDYRYTDSDPSLGLSYYRLSQTDFDGTTEHFPMISVLYTPDDNKLNVYPNPAMDGLLKLQTTGKMKNETISLRILDLQGKLMCERSITADEFGFVDLQIDLQNIQRRSAYIFNLISRSENEFVRVLTE